MMRKVSVLAATLVAALMLAPVTPARGAVISNGDLETLGTSPALFADWTNNGGVSLASQAIGGSNSAKIVRNTDSTGNALRQTFNDPAGELDVFNIGFDFAASDGGSSSNRSMQVNFRTTVGSDSGNINLRIVRGSAAGIGTVQVHNGSAFVDALADSVAFSSSETGAGFVVNHIMVAGNYETTPTYTITVNGVTSAPLSLFQGTAPAAGTTLKEVAFQSGNLVSDAWSVVDNVAVPEPAGLGLLGASCLGLLVQRRRRRA